MQEPEAARPRGVSAADKRRRLKARLAEQRLLVAPGIFDMISARIADRMGFDVLYMTGYGTVASYLGLPDAGLATYTDMQSRARAFAEGTDTPVIADGDTGYGGLLNVAHTVRGYEAAGVCGIQLEDQKFPKKCGHTQGRRVIATADMVAKIRVAAEAREDGNFLIVARTDARSPLGLNEALQRAEAYADAGADVLFVESPESREELQQIAQRLAQRVPLLVNNVEGGRTPILSRAELQQMGFRLAIHPVTGFLAAAQAMQAAYAGLADQEMPADLATRLYDFDAFNRLMGFEQVWAFEAAHASSDNGAD